jgi:Uma2 family endonuclease
MVSMLDRHARVRRWTRVEYERLIELGVFRPDERLELIDGALLVREPQGSRHAAAIRRVLDALRPVLGDSWQIDSQLPIALGEGDEPEPDVCVVPRSPDAYRHRHPTGPVMIVEVAEASYKSSLYARAGIPEYWVVDVVRNQVEVHREPERAAAAPCGFRYRAITTLRPPHTVIPLVAPGRPIAIADLLP